MSMTALYMRIRNFDLKRAIRRLGKINPKRVPSKWTIDEAGVCINDVKIVSAKAEECATGSVRKFRNGVKNDDGKCGTCPYFFSDELLWEVYRSGVCDENKLCKTKTGKLRLIARTKWEWDECKLIGEILGLDLCDLYKCKWVKKAEECEKNER